MEEVLGLLTVELGVAQVDQDQVHVRAAGEDGDALVLDVGAGQTLGEDAGAGQGPDLPVGELLGGGDLERGGLGGDHVHERAALLAGEDRGVELLGELLLGQDQAGAGAAERLVHGGGHDVGVGHRRGCRPAATRPAKWAMSTHR